MATGSGKTVVMAMLVAWHALNKMDDRQDARFSDAFLIVTPGITIRDRLRVLLPTDPDNLTIDSATSCRPICWSAWRRPESSSPTSTRFSRTIAATPRA